MEKVLPAPAAESASSPAPKSPRKAIPLEPAHVCTLFDHLKRSWNGMEMWNYC